MKRKDLIVLITLAFVQFSNILDGMIMMPLAPTIKEVFHIDTRHFGWLVSSFGIAAGCSAFFSTFWADKFDRKKILVVLYIGFIIGTFFCAISPNYKFFLIARIFTGLFGGVCGSVIMAIVGDIIPNDKRARAMGIIMMGFALASVVGVPMGLIIANSFNWQMPFYVICAIGFLVLISIIVFIPNVTGHLNEPKRHTVKDFYRTVFTNQSIIIALSLPAIMVVAHMAIIPYITDFSVNNLHLSRSKDVPLMYLIGGVLSVVNSPFVGKLADKHGRYKVFAILSFIALFPIFFITNLQSASLVVFLICTSFFFIGSGGRLIPVQAMVTSAVLPQFRGSFMALNSALQQFTMGVITLIGGLIITNNSAGELEHYNIVGYIAIVGTLVSLIIARKVKVLS